MFQIIGVLVFILCVVYGAYKFLQALRGGYQGSDVRPETPGTEYHCDDCRKACSPNTDAQRENGSA